MQCYKWSVEATGGVCARAVRVCESVCRGTWEGVTGGAGGKQPNKQRQHQRVADEADGLARPARAVF
jgi:hypothetical protein